MIVPRGLVVAVSASIVVDATAGPPNDDCSHATPIVEGATPFDTTGATTDGTTLTGFCDPGPFGDDQIHNDVWFEYLATCSGELTLSTCNTASFDTRLAIYASTDCPEVPASVIGCNDDAPGCAGFTSELTVPVVKDETYLVRVGGFSAGDSGTGTLELTPADDAPAVLRLESIVIPGGYEPGDLFNVHVKLGNLCENEAAGFQAFVEFDPAVMSFVAGVYTSSPFGQPVIDPITAAPSGEMNLASGIDFENGQPATSADAVLAVLTFQVLDVPDQCVPPIDFREHDPPTRLTDVGGEEILPLKLERFPPPRDPGDVNFDGAVDVLDLVAVILGWGPCPPPPTYCFADLDCDGQVDVEDLVEVILNWS